MMAIISLRVFTQFYCFGLISFYPAFDCTPCATHCGSIWSLHMKVDFSTDFTFPAFLKEERQVAQIVVAMFEIISKTDPLVQGTLAKSIPINCRGI